MRKIIKIGALSNMGKVKSKEGQLKSIKSGEGIQCILDEAYRILENPMLVFDMEYNLIAYSNAAVNDDPIWNEFITNGKLGSKTIEFMKDESFIDDVANSTVQDGVVYLISGKLKYKRIFGQIYNKDGIPIADLVSVECEKPFDDDTPRLIKSICAILTKEFGKSDISQNYGQSYMESIIKKLIDGSIRDRALYAGHIANVDKDFNKNIYLVVADISKCSPNYSKLVSYRDLFKRTQPSFKYAVYSNYIVILISPDRERLHAKTDLKKLCGLFKQHNIYAGISGCFENLYELQCYYFEAVEALNYGLNSDSAQRIFLYDEIMANSESLFDF